MKKIFLKFKIKAIFGVLAVPILVVTVCVANLSLNALINNSITNNKINLTSSTVLIQNQIIHTTCKQTTWSDGSDLDTDWDNCANNNVNFSQNFKRIYLSKNYQTIDASNFVSNINVANADTNKCCGTCGGDYNYDATKRIQDWSKGYRNNLRINVDQPQMNWGVSTFKPGLYTTMIWPSKTNQNAIKGTVVFEKNGQKNYEYNSGKDLHFNVGTNRNLTCLVWDCYGIPYSFLKESQRICVFWNWVDRYWYLLSPSLNDANKLTTDVYGIDVIGGINKQLTGGVFNLNKLININGCDYNQKTIHIGLNQKWIDFAIYLNYRHDAIKQLIEQAIDYHDENFKQIIEFLVDRNLIDENNYQSVINDRNINSFDNLETLSRYVCDTYPSQIMQQVIGEGWNPYDNPWPILNDIKDQLNFNINYTTPNFYEPTNLEKHCYSFNYQNLVKGFDIAINLNQNKNYEFCLDSINTNEVNTPEMYIQGWSTNHLMNNSAQLIENMDGSYKMEEPTIANVSFNNVDVNFINSVHPYDLNDEQIINKFLTISDSYQCTWNYQSLDKNMYLIKRNEIEGTIQIIIHANNHTFSHTYEGFRRAIQQIRDINSELIYYNTVAIDLDQEKITALLIANKENTYIAQHLHYVIEPNNDETIVQVRVDKVSDSELVDLYLNQTFLITNLQPYHIRLKQNFSKKSLNCKPSEVKLDDFKHNFLDISDEFYNRNKGTLTINLKSNNKVNTLTAKITWIEEKNNEWKALEFVVGGFNQHHNMSNIILYVIVGIAGLGGICLGSYFTYRKFYPKRLDKMPE